LTSNASAQAGSLRAVPGLALRVRPVAVGPEGRLRAGAAAQRHRPGPSPRRSPPRSRHFGRIRSRPARGTPASPQPLPRRAPGARSRRSRPRSAWWPCRRRLGQEGVPRPRADVQDPAAPAPDHLPGDEPVGQEHRRRDVDPDHPLDARPLRAVLKGLVSDAGAAHEHVDRSRRLQHGVGHPLSCPRSARSHGSTRTRCARRRLARGVPGTPGKTAQPTSTPADRRP